jgi:tripartite-type tricarboxylate transporter receptor subunit TctC
MARWLERLGQPIIIENKPGGGTNIGVQARSMRRPMATRCYLEMPVPSMQRSMSGFPSTSSATSRRLPDWSAIRW